MRCASCGHDPPAGAEFCPECGTRLDSTCASCGAPREAGHKFCVKCGAPLAAAVEANRGASKPAERRQLTVMFCDLVGSTAVSSVLDPEEMRELIRAYQDACAAVIARFEGHVAQYLGDGLLVYFGYPQAHEDDARRSVRAALDIVETIRHLDVQPPAAVRVGIHTGLVVVGEMGGSGRQEQLALGETPNLAARLQATAAPGSVVVSEATHRLAEGAFRWHDLGEQSLKGFSHTQRLWQALGEIGGRSRVAPPDAPTLVGRDGEMSLLRQRWEQARRGDGQVVLLTGEPGIGKSRITETFVDDVRREATATLHYFCSPYYQNSALHPFVAHVVHAAGIAPDELPTRKLDRLERWLDAAGGTREQAPLFAALLSIPFADRYAPLDLSPPAQREKTLQAMEEQLARLAGASPVLAVFEDAHWIDPTSRTMLDRFVELVPRLRVLLVVTARPEFTASWTRLPHVTLLTLNHLGRAEAAHLVAQVARDRRLSSAVIAGIVQRAEGIPLYVEEITKATLDADDRIPATLRDSLTGRLDRLGWVKEVAQAASVIGREFEDELLSSIVDVPDERRKDALEQLVAAQLVAERRHPARTVHYFRHALIQEAAYQSLLNATRRRYHAKIAEALEHRFPDRAENEPETLAQHFTEAGDDARAIPYWHRAGVRAAQRSANLEAVEHLRKGLELLRRRPSAEQELSLLIALGPALMATQGWNAPEVETVYARARVLAAETGRSTDVFPAAWGRWLVAHAGGEAQRARELLDELFTLLRDTNDPSLLLQAHHAAGSNMCTDADLAAAKQHIDAGIRIYRFEEHRHQALVYGGHDPCVCAQGQGALTELMLGNPRRSRELSDDALALAARLGHTPSIAHADVYRAELSHILGNVDEAAARAERILAVASAIGIAHYAAWALMALGWATIKRGAIDDGLTKLADGLVALRATGNRYHLPHRLTLRAEALAAAGRTAEAHEAIDEALEAVERTGELWYEPEVLRVKAAIDPTSAERCLERAVTAARAHGARFWELRSAVALAELRAGEKRQDAARRVLAAALHGFEDERELPEIGHAIALLDQLGRVDSRP